MHSDKKSISLTPIYTTRRYESGCLKKQTAISCIHNDQLFSVNIQQLPELKEVKKCMQSKAALTEPKDQRESHLWRFMGQSPPDIGSVANISLLVKWRMYRYLGSSTKLGSLSNMEAFSSAFLWAAILADLVKWFFNDAGSPSHGPLGSFFFLSKILFTVSKEFA